MGLLDSVFSLPKVNEPENLTLPDYSEDLYTSSPAGLGTLDSADLNDGGFDVDAVWASRTPIMVRDDSIDYSSAGSTKLLDEAVGAVTDRFGADQAEFDSLIAKFDAMNMFDGTGLEGTSAVKSSSVSASQINAAGGGTSSGNDDHIVQLVSMVDDTLVKFVIMPEVGEQRNAEYEALSATQMPGEFQKYKGTKATQWNVNAMFTASTREQARQNYEFINRLRSWVMPYFGENQRGKMLGAPPPVLAFSGWRGIVGKVPVVLTSLNWQWPRDCDWIPIDDAVESKPFPSVINVQINLVESFSAVQFNAFDLLAFSNGDMIEAYGGDRKVNRSEPSGELESDAKQESGVQATSFESDYPTSTASEPFESNYPTEASDTSTDPGFTADSLLASGTPIMTKDTPEPAAAPAPAPAPAAPSNETEIARLEKYISELQGSRMESADKALAAAATDADRAKWTSQKEFLNTQASAAQAKIDQLKSA